MRRSHILNALQVRQIRVRRQAGETHAAIAADYGVDPTAISYQTREIRVPRRPSLCVCRAIALLRLGCTRRQTAQRLGVTTTTLWKYLKRAGVPACAPQKIAA